MYNIHIQFKIPKCIEKTSTLPMTNYLSLQRTREIIKI